MPPSKRGARSYLYVPADGQERLSGAVRRGAEAVIVDLEDSVAEEKKNSARHTVRSWLRATEMTDRVGGMAPVERWVRINSGQQGLDDLEDILWPGITGVCLPKVASDADVRRVSSLLDKWEEKVNLPAGSVVLMPLIETAAGLQSLQEIAESPRVHRLQIGEIDLAADLGVSADDDETELLPLRISVVVASAAAGLCAPVGAVSPEFHDLAWLTASTERLKRAGFYGRAAIHPRQLESIHRVFDVHPAEVSTARQLIELWDTAAKSGIGAFVGPDGRMVDEAVIRRSRDLIESAETTLEKDAE